MREVVRCNFLILTLLLFGIQNAETEEDLDKSQEVLNHFFELFSDAAFGYEKSESAGWIVRKNEGYILWKWPTSEEKSKQVWAGPVPDGVVAIAHTHPTSDIQKPSDQDVSMAKQLNMSVYTICKGGIWKTTSNGEVTRIQPRDWFKELKQKQLVKENKTNTSRTD